MCKQSAEVARLSLCSKSAALGRASYARMTVCISVSCGADELDCERLNLSARSAYGLTIQSGWSLRSTLGHACSSWLTSCWHVPACNARCSIEMASCCELAMRSTI